jgi:hypothetical protein
MYSSHYVSTTHHRDKEPEAGVDVAAELVEVMTVVELMVEEEMGADMVVTSAGTVGMEILLEMTNVSTWTL